MGLYDEFLSGQSTNDELLARYRLPVGNGKVSRDEYGYTEKDREAEKARIYKSLGQSAPTQPVNSPYGGLSIPDAYSDASGQSSGEQIEISDEYASRHRAERLGKTNLLDKNRKGKVGDTQYTNDNPGVDRSTPTGWLEKTADSMDDSFDDAWKYIFGNKKHKNKKEEEEAARDDMNMQVNEDGNIIYSRQATMNDTPLETLRNQVMNLEDDPEGDQLLYYGRVDNPDGTSSYKIGLAGADTFGRTSEEDRGKDITYLWAKRTKDAAKYEALFHGNRELLKSRRNDIGTDVEGYGAGKTEIYNEDFLGLDGTMSMDKIKTLNMSTASKLRELGVYTTGRYDSKGMESGYKALDKAERIYGKESKQYKEMSYLMSNMEHTGKRTRALADVPMDLISGAGSGLQQVAFGLGDMALDAVTPGNNALLDNIKSAETADEAWGYRGRKETEVLGREAVRAWKQGDHVGALLKGIEAGPDTIAQSAADMGLMMITGGAGTAATAGRLAAKRFANEIAKKEGAALVSTGLKGRALRDATRKATESKLREATTKEALEKAKKAAVTKFENSTSFNTFLDMKKNIGLTAFAAKQTNNQIDDRIENGDTSVWEEIPAMFASNYVLGGLDRLAFKKEIDIKGIKTAIGLIPDSGMVGFAKKAATLVTSMIKKGAIEAAQEFVQEGGEAINSGLGTEKYGNDPFSEHFLDAATKGALLGFGAGTVTHGTTAVVGGAVRGGKERARNKRININPDMFGEIENELNIEVDTSKEPTSRTAFRGYHPEDHTPEQTYELFSKNSEAKGMPETISSILDEMKDGAWLENGLTDPIVRALRTSILDKAVTDGKITEEQKTEYLAKIKEMTSDVSKPFNIIHDETANPADKQKATDNLNHIAANVDPNNLTGFFGMLEKTLLDENGEITLEKLDTLISLKDSPHTSKEAKATYTQFIDTLLQVGEETTNDIYDDAANAYNNDSGTETLGSSSSSSKAFDNALNKKYKKGSVEPENLVQALLNVARDNNFTDEATISSVKDYITRSIDELDDDTPMKSKQLAEFVLTSKSSNMKEFRLKRLLTKFSKMSDRELEAVIDAQDVIATGYARSKGSIRKGSSSMLSTIKGIYTDTTGKHSRYGTSLSGYLQGVMEVLSEDTSAGKVRVLLDTMEKLKGFSGTKNTKNTNPSNSSEIETLGELEKLDVEKLSNIFKELLFDIEANNTSSRGYSARASSTQSTNNTTKDSKKKQKKKQKQKQQRTETSIVAEHTLAKAKELTTLLEEEEDTKVLDEKIKQILSNSLNPNDVIAAMDVSIETEELLEYIVEEIADERGTDNRKAVEAVRKQLSEKYSGIYRTAKHVLNVIFPKPVSKVLSLTVDKLSETLVQTFTSKGKLTVEAKALERVTTLIEQLNTSIFNLELDPTTSKIKPEDNPFLYYLLNEEGKIPKDLHESIIKGILEATKKHSVALSMNSKNNDGDILPGTTRAEFVRTMAKAIKTELEVITTEEEILSSYKDVDGKNISAKDKVAPEVVTNMAESLALLVTSKLTTDNTVFETNTVTSKEEGIAPIHYVSFKTHAKYDMMDSGVREQDIALTSIYKDMVDNNLVGKTEQQGIVSVDHRIEEKQKRLKHTDDKLNDTSRDTIEHVENARYKISEYTKGIFNLKPEKLLKMLGLDIKLLKPKDVLNNTSFTLEQYYELVFGEKPADTLSADDITVELIHSYESNLKDTTLHTDISKLSYEGKVQEKLQLLKGIKEAKDYVNEAFHYGGFIGANGRAYLRGLGLVEPQSNKFFRYAFLTEPVRNNMVRMDNADGTLSMFMSSLAETLEDFVDEPTKRKAGNSDSQEHTEMFGNIKIKEEVKALVTKLVESADTMTEDELGALEEEIDLFDTSVLSSIYAYIKYTAAEKSGSAFFVHDAASSVDGKTSALAIISANEGKVEDVWDSLLATGQLTITAINELSKKYPHLADKLKDITSIPEIKRLGIKLDDGYELTARIYLENNPKMAEALELLLGDKLIEEGVDGTTVLTSAGRAFAKDPLMTFLYGTQEKRMSNDMANVLLEKVFSRIQTLYTNPDKAVVDKLIKGFEVLIGEAELSNKNIGVKVNIPTLNTVRILRKQLENIDHTNINKINTFLYEEVSPIMLKLVGGKMFEAVESKNEVLVKNRELLNNTGSLSYLFHNIIEAYLTELNISNRSASMSETFQKYKHELLQSILLNLGGGDVDQKITVRKTEVAVGLDSHDRLKVPSVAKDGNEISIPNVNFVAAENPNAAGVVDVHRVDKNMINSSIHYGFAQVFDAVVVSSSNLSGVEGILNLEFLANTYYAESTSYDNSIETIDNILKIIEDLSAQGDKAFIAVMIDVLGKQAKGIGKGRVFTEKPKVGFTTFTNRLKQIKEELAVAKEEHIVNKEEKLQETKSIAQYATASRVTLKDGNVDGVVHDRKGVTNLEDLNTNDTSSVVKEIATTFELEEATGETLSTKGKDKVKSVLNEALTLAGFTKQKVGKIAEGIIKHIGTQKVTTENYYKRAILSEIFNSKELTGKQKTIAANHLMGMDMDVTEIVDSVVAYDNVAVNKFIQEYVTKQENIELLREQKNKERAKEILENSASKDNADAITNEDIENLSKREYWNPSEVISKKVWKRIHKLFAPKKNGGNAGTYVGIDLEFTFGERGTGYTSKVFEFAYIKYKNGKEVTGDTVLHRPEDFDTYIAYLEATEDKNSAYLEPLLATNFTESLDEKGLDTEEDLAKEIFVKLDEATEQGSLPLAAYNGINADFLRIQELAIRTNNAELLRLIHGIEIIDAYVASSSAIDRTSDDFVSHKQGDLYESYYKLGKLDTKHRGLEDVRTMHEVMKAMAKDFKEEVKPEPKKEQTNAVLEENFTQEEIDAANEDFGDELGSSPTSELSREAAASTLDRIKEETIEDIFETVIEMDKENIEEKTFLRDIFDTLVNPFYKGGVETLLAVIENEDEASDSKTEGTTWFNPTSLDTIGIIHRREGAKGKSAHSSASVLMHEIGHVITDKLFGSRLLDDQFNVEKMYFEEMYNEARLKADETWFADNDMKTYNYVFKNSKGKLRGMKEFYAIALSDYKFSQMIAKNIRNPAQTKGVKIDKSGVIPFIEFLFAKILDYVINFGRTQNNINAHELLLSIALDMNGLENVYKSGAFNKVRSTLDKVEAYNATLKYIDMDSIFHNKYTYALGVIPNLNLEPSLLHNALISDYTSPLGGFLQDVLPSTDFMNEYVAHATRAATTVVKERDTMVKNVSNLILGTNKANKAAITIEEDTELYNLALKYDMRALYILEKDENAIIGSFANDMALEAYTVDLEKGIKASPELVEAMQQAGKALHDRATNQSTDRYADPESSNSESLARLYGKKPVGDTKATKEEITIDAIITLNSLVYVSQTVKDTFVKDVESNPSLRSAFRQTLSIANDVEVERRKLLTSKNKTNFVKGSTVKVTDDNIRLVPVILTQKIEEEMAAEGYPLVEIVELTSAGITVGIYKVENSPLNNRRSGSVDIIDLETQGSKNLAQLLVEAGVTKNAIKKILGKVRYNETEKISRFLVPALDSAGESVSDFTFTIPEFLENEHLNVDTRASTSLAHAKGKIVEYNNAMKENDNWLAIAATDVRENYVNNPKDFVWVGLDSTREDLKNYYKVLPAYLKHKILGDNVLSNNGKKGMWIRKEALTMTLGAEGKSMVDLLRKFNITNKTVRHAIQLIEKGLIQLGKFYKLEIVQKTIGVVGGNLMSNVLLEMLKGRHNYVEVIQTMFRNMREVYRINKLQKDISKKRIETRKSPEGTTKRALERELKVMYKSLKTSPIYYMIAEGFNDNFIDDVNIKESMFMGDFDKKVYKFSEKHPKLRFAFDQLYMTKGTTSNKWVSNAFILADIAAQITSDQLDKKYLAKDINIEFKAYFKMMVEKGFLKAEDRGVEYHKFKQVRIKEYADTRIKRLAEMTIMYPVVTGGYVADYLDRINVLPFYKFKLRIKRVLMQRLRERGAISKVMLAVEAYFDKTVVDLEMAQESLFDVMSGVSLSPIENGLEGLTPALVDMLTGN